MLNIGAGEILVIALVALIVVGPEQLPGLIRRVGKAIGQVRSMTDGLKDEFMSSFDEADDLKKMVDPKSWSAGAGTNNDPIVPRGLADASEDGAEEASAKPELVKGSGEVKQKTVYKVDPPSSTELTDDP